MTDIIFRVPDDMAQTLLDLAKHMPEVEIVSYEQPTDCGLADMDRRMAFAINLLEKNGALRYCYDYTWIMVAIGDGVIKGMDAFRSPQSFMDYLALLGLEHIPSRTTISTYNNKVCGEYPNWTFIDTNDPHEILRRKNVVRQLQSALCQWGQNEG